MWQAIPSPKRTYHEPTNQIYHLDSVRKGPPNEYLATDFSRIGMARDFAGTTPSSWDPSLLYLQVDLKQAPNDIWVCLPTWGVPNCRPKRTKHHTHSPRKMPFFPAEWDPKKDKSELSTATHTNPSNFIVAFLSMTQIQPTLNKVSPPGTSIDS